MIAAPLRYSPFSLLYCSNAMYVAGAVLTLGAAIRVLIEKRAVTTRKHSKNFRISDALLLVAAVVSLVGTIGAIHFGDVVNRIKDAELTAYETDGNLRIADSNAKAEFARNATAELQNENLRLEAKQKGDENKLADVDTRTAERKLIFSQNDATSLKPYANSKIYIDCAAQDSEALNLCHALYSSLSTAKMVPVVSHMFGPGPSTPLARPGVHIHFGTEETRKLLAENLQKILARSHIPADIIATESNESDMKMQGADVSSSLIIYVAPRR